MMAATGTNQQDQAPSPRFDPRTCWICGGPHLKRDCPKLPEAERKAYQERSFQGVCFCCGVQGHSSNRCPKKARAREGQLTCKVCKSKTHTTEGHKARDAPSSKKSSKSTDVDELKVMLASTLTSISSFIKDRKKDDAINLTDFQD